MPLHPAPTTATGLSEAEAASRLRDLGPNELPTTQARSPFTIVWEVLQEPMFLLLLACGGIYFFLGDRQEALMLLAFVVLVAGITWHQEQKTERSLEALRDLSSPHALVVREGVRRRIPARELVPGDRIVVAEGERVPADAALRDSAHLSVDESLLSGESLPVLKSLWDGQSPWVGPGGRACPSCTPAPW